MLATSAAVLVLSASAMVSPLTNLLHLHPKPATQDTRIQISIRNEARMFREIMVENHVYTIMPSHDVTIKANPGTVVYYADGMGTHKAGEVFVAIDASLKGHQLPIK